MDSNECPQVTVIPAERGWELVIWQAGGDGEPDPHGGLRYLPVLAWRVEHHRHDDGDFDMTVPVAPGSGPDSPVVCRAPDRYLYDLDYGTIGSEPDDQTALWDHLARRFAEHRAEASGTGKVRRLRPVLKPQTK
jgi:hypothetical protein